MGGYCVFIFETIFDNYYDNTFLHLISFQAFQQHLNEAGWQVSLEGSWTLMIMTDRGLDLGSEQDHHLVQWNTAKLITVTDLWMLFDFNYFKTLIFEFYLEEN